MPILAPQQRIGYLGGGIFFRNFSTTICYELRLVLFGAHVLVQVPNLKIGRLPAIFLLKSRFSFTLPLGFLLALAKGNLKEGASKTEIWWKITKKQKIPGESILIFVLQRP